MTVPSAPNLDELLSAADRATAGGDREAAYRALIRSAPCLARRPERCAEVADRLERSGFPAEANAVRQAGERSGCGAFELLLGFSRVAAERGDRQTALAVLEDAATEADERWCRVRLADAFLELGKVDRFRRELDLARALAWNDSALLVAIGRRFRKIGELWAAEASFRAALMRADDGLTRIELARVLHESGWDEEAEDLIERTLRSGAKRRDPSWLRRALWELAGLRNEQGREADALALLQRLAAVDPEHNEFHWSQYRLGEQLARMGRRDEARKLLTLARETSDDDLRRRMDAVLSELDNSSG